MRWKHQAETRSLESRRGFRIEPRMLALNPGSSKDAAYCQSPAGWDAWLCAGMGPGFSDSKGGVPTHKE